MASKAKYAMPNGSYPINSCADVSDAAKLAHHSSTYSFAQVKAHVMRAKAALGCPDSVLPATWSSGQSSLQETQAMSEIERRYTLVPVELRANADRRAIGGYAAVFKRMSSNLGGFVEQVLPTFFNKSRGDGWPDVLCRYNHDDNMLLGTTGGGTLRLQIDETGLIYEVDPPQARQDIVELVGRGDVRKSSFAFRVHEDEWTQSDQGFPMRSLHSGQLVDVAPVNIPAYTDSSAGLRSLANHFDADFEEVRKLAAENELSKFFVRTGGKISTPAKKQKPTLLGAMALLDIVNREHDPWEGAE